MLQVIHNYFNAELLKKKKVVLYFVTHKKSLLIETAYLCSFL